MISIERLDSNKFENPETENELILLNFLEQKQPVSTFEVVFGPIKVINTSKSVADIIVNNLLEF